MGRPDKSVLIEVGIGPLSPKLRAIIKSLSEETTELRDKVVAALCESIPVYSEIGDQATLQDVCETVNFGIRLWYQTLLSGRSPSVEELEPFTACGRNRVHQSIPLSSLLQAFRLSSRHYWDSLLQRTSDDPEVGREVLLKVSPYVLHYFDILGQQVSQAYAAELHQKVQWRDNLRAGLCDVIYNRPEDIEAFREHAQALGIDASAAHIAVALKLDERTMSRAGRESDISPVLDALSRLLEIDREMPLRTWRNGHLLVWLPLTVGEHAADACRRLVQQLRGINACCNEVAMVGIGLPHAQPSGWRTSAVQALRAIEVGARLSQGESVFRYLDFALEDAVAAQDITAHYFDELLARLAAEPLLIETLNVYFKHRQQRKVAAGVLNIHPNTLTYRLARIESLLSARLDDTGWIAILHTALRLRHLAQSAKHYSR
jgi:carbohydrate diacid regulator